MQALTPFSPYKHFPDIFLLLSPLVFFLSPQSWPNQQDQMTLPNPSLAAAAPKETLFPALDWHKKSTFVFL